MREFLINTILPLVATGLVSGVLIPVATSTIRLIKTKEKEAEQRLIANGHESELNTAKEIFNIVEEKYRITENAFSILGSKADYFDKLLLSKIPYIKEEDLRHLRQAIAGEFNKDKEPVLGADLSTQLQNANSELQKLQVENEQLKAKLIQVNSVVNIQG